MLHGSHPPRFLTLTEMKYLYLYVAIHKQYTIVFFTLYAIIKYSLFFCSTRITLRDIMQRNSGKSIIPVPSLSTCVKKALHTRSFMGRTNKTGSLHPVKYLPHIHHVHYPPSPGWPCPVSRPLTGSDQVASSLRLPDHKPSQKKPPSKYDGITSVKILNLTAGHGPVLVAKPWLDVNNSFLNSVRPILTYLEKASWYCPIASIDNRSTILKALKNWHMKIWNKKCVTFHI